MLLSDVDLAVYRGAGLVARDSPGQLYQWQQSPGLRFTYTPFAAVLCIDVSGLPSGLAAGLMLAGSVAALLATVWLAFSGLGRDGTSRLGSPVSWDHHWVWIAPALAVLADMAIRGRGAVRAAWSASAGLVAVVFGAWPSLWKGGGSAVPWGLIWYAPYTRYGTGGIHPEYHWAGLQMLAGNLYLLAGFVMLATAATATARHALHVPHHVSFTGARPGQAGQGRTVVTEVPGTGDIQP